MRNYIFGIMALAVTALSVSGCENPVTSATDNPAEQQEEVKYKTVSFNVTGFEVTTEDITTTRADKALSEISTITNLTVALFTKSGDDEEYEKTYTFQQTSSDSNFGTISAFVAYGSYKIVAVANGGDDYYTVASPTSVSKPESMERVKDTFTYVGDLSVNESSDTAPSIVLKRAVAAVCLRITEIYADLPETFDHFELELTGGSTVLNPTTGLGTENSTQTIEETYTGNDTSVPLGIYTFATSGNSLEFVAKAIDKDGDVIRTRRFSGFSLTANTMIVHKGEFFADNDNFSILVDETSSSWKSETITFQ